MKLQLITPQFKASVAEMMRQKRKNFGGSDAQFSKTLGINPAIYSRVTHDEVTGVMSDTRWLSVARELGVSTSDRQWNLVRTEVYRFIEEEVRFCQEFCKSRIFVDDCEIGKTVAAKHLSNTLKNCFYIDGSQAKTRPVFIRLLAKTLGLDQVGLVNDIKENIKYYLKMLNQPILIIDEFGDLSTESFMELKELWNATEGLVGWYLIGAEGAKAKWINGIRANKVGFREMFSRYSSSYSAIVPKDRTDRTKFYRKLITEVLTGNVADATIVPEIVNKCLNLDGGGLRRAESILILKTMDAS